MVDRVLADVVTRDELVDVLAGLPEESLGDLCDFIAFLHYRTHAHNGRPALKGRLCRDLPTLGEADLAEAREGLIDLLSHSDNHN